MKQHTWKGKTVWYVSYSDGKRVGLFDPMSPTCGQCACSGSQTHSCLFGECGDGLMIADTETTRVALVKLRLTT